MDVTLRAKWDEIVPGFEYSTSGGNVIIAEYTGSGGSVTIPSIINGLPVTAIRGSAFIGCADLTSVVIPSSVTTIEELASSSAFRHGPSTGRIIYVPAAGVAAYKADANWATYETAAPGTIQGE